MADHHNIDPLLLADPSNFIQDQRPQPQPVSAFPTTDQAQSTGFAEQNGPAAQVVGNDDLSRGPFDISHDVVEWLLQQPYDISWPQKLGVEHATIAAMFKGPWHTFEALYRHGVLKIDDELCGMCLYSKDGIENGLEMVAKIVGEVRLPDSSLRPHVKIMWNEDCWAELPACHGTLQMAQTFERVVRQDTGGHVTHNAFRSYHHLCLRRDDVYLGTLYEIRTAWTVWRSEMDSWAKTHGIKYRRTRGEKRKRSSSADSATRPRQDPRLSTE
ncbi:MAG: hypothetical protein Q9212_003209 [Teloschistes hypoglaucus]